MPNKPIHFSNFDLNLLLVLDALLKERNVTRAAELLHLTQPAVSSALGRIRDHFGDPILMRTPTGMQPTPRALEIEPHLKNALSLIETKVFQHEGFNPQTTTLKMNIAITDYAELVIIPRLVERLYHEAPDLRIEFSFLVNFVPVQELASGSIDMALGFFIEKPVDLYVQTLFEDPFVTVHRRGHPDFKGKDLTLKQFTEAKHILVSPWGGMEGIAEETLAKMKLSRSVNIAVPHFMIAPLLASQSDYIVTLPEKIVKPFAKTLDLHLQKPPIEMRTSPATLIWHGRTHKSDSHKWLRNLILEVASERKTY